MAEPEYQVESGPFDEQLVFSVSHLATEIFGAIDETDLHWRLKHLPVATLALAFFDGDLIGFKFGHALSTRRYQSWLGGVLARARRQGVARRLMELQHEWVAKNGFSSIETGATHDNIAMLALNRETGFRVIGEHNRDGVVRIMHYKEL